MAQLQSNLTCSDCIEIFKKAASLLLSKSVEAPLPILFDASYRTRLATGASSSRCHMCVLLTASISRLLEPFNPKEELWLQVSRTKRDHYSAEIELVGRHSNVKTGYPGSVRIQDGEENTKITSMEYLELMALVGHGHVSVLNSPSTWSPETLNRVQSWLKSCTLSHDECAKPRAISRLPRRLIDVMSTRFSRIWPMDKVALEDFNLLSLENFHNVRIVSSQSLPQETPYVTLSHRWGNPPSILLTEKNSFLLRDDISPHLLNCPETATFRHAIHVTRCLGFRYIWIDALCIMQDNGTEKTADIMQMDEVYSNSRLNISAAEGQILKGLIFNRKLLEFNPCRATVRVRESQEDVNLYAFPDRFFLRPTEAPLNKRGWVFQERTLAPRIIHFTKNQVFWECHSLEASEVLPQGDSLELGHVGKGVGISSALSKQELQSRWYAFVSHYSGTSVTYSEDRLLALSAVAKQFCLAMRLDPSKYLAGVWEDELPLSMLWHQVPDPDMRGPELIASIAPSWSWASIGGQISYIELSRQISNVELLGVQATRISPNPFGGTSSCRLRLRGAVCKCRRYVRSGVPWVCITQRTKFQESANAPGDNQVGIYWDKSRKAVADWLNTIGSSSSSSTCFLLHIASQKEDQLGPIQRGVILQRTAIRGTYTRIGSFFIFRDSYSNSDLENAFNGHLNTLDTDDYLELNSIGKYTINIV